MALTEPAGSAERWVEDSVARVVTPDGQEVCGMAFAVGEYMVTCAHVVNAALGRPESDWSRPAETTEVRLEFPRTDRPRPISRQATIAHWLPPPDRWDDQRDVAVLDLAGDLPSGVATVRLDELRKPLYDAEVRVYGFDPTAGHEIGLDGKVMSRSARRGLQVDVDASIHTVQHGFSGGPVWLCGRDQPHRIVGVLAAGTAGSRHSAVYVIPSDLLSRFVPQGDKPRQDVPPDVPKSQLTDAAMDQASPPLPDEEPSQGREPSPPVAPWVTVLRNRWLLVVPIVAGIVAAGRATRTVTAGRVVLQGLLVAVAVWSVAAIVAGTQTWLAEHRTRPEAE